MYEDGILTESIFAMLADAHPGILAVKVDGATKEDFAWGYRVGFLTYAFNGSTPDGLKALEDKTAGIVRGSISNAAHLSQSMLLAAYRSPEYSTWKSDAFKVLEARYRTVRSVLAAHPEYGSRFAALPFNSGYFLCVILHVPTLNQRLSDVVCSNSTVQASSRRAMSCGSPSSTQCRHSQTLCQSRSGDRRRDNGLKRRQPDRVLASSLRLL